VLVVLKGLQWLIYLALFVILASICQNRRQDDARQGTMPTNPIGIRSTKLLTQTGR
jgi:hypothetical protein